MADPAPIIAENVSHSYGSGSMRRQVLQDINFRVDPGEVVLLTGPSGCGKTTLLTLVGALRSLQHGQLQVLGVPLAQAGRGERRRLRQRIGMIFQGHNLLRCLTAEQNVQMGADLLPGLSYGQRRGQARERLRAGVWVINSAKCPTISRAGKNNGWRSLAPWRRAPACCWPMNPPRPWMAARVVKSLSCCSGSRVSRVAGC